MTHATLKLVGLIVGGLAALATHRLARERRPLPRRLAALAVLLIGAAAATALVRAQLPMVLYDDLVREAASRVVVLELAAVAVGLAGALLLAAGRPAVAATAGLALLVLTWRLLLAFAAWSHAVWGEVVLAPRERFIIDLGTHVAVALALLLGALTTRRASPSSSR